MSADGHDAARAATGDGAAAAAEGEGDGPAGRGSAGPSFHGRPTRRLANADLWVDVLASGGPRILRLGRAGSSLNLLAETPDIGWQTAHGRYDLLGGHRLWFAPEDPDLVAMPDGGGLRIAAAPDGLRLTGAVERPTGLIRSMTLRLPRGRPGLEIGHELRNTGSTSIELAPWAITQLPLGGLVLLPQAAATPGHHVRPNRMLVLWPYTSWEDSRLRPRDGLVSLAATAGPSLKVGYFNDAGWVAYVRDDVVLIRRFEPLRGEPHPDLGCNVEVFIGTRFLELELLGRLGVLEPGSTATLVEHWDVQAIDPTPDGIDPRLIAARVAGP